MNDLIEMRPLKKGRGSSVSDRILLHSMSVTEPGSIGLGKLLGSTFIWLVVRQKFGPPLHHIFNEGSGPGLEFVSLVAPSIVPTAIDRFALLIFRRVDLHIL